MGSGVRVVALGYLSRENAGITMSVFHEGLSGDDFDQTPVSIILSLFVRTFFWFCGRSNIGNRPGIS